MVLAYSTINIFVVISKLIVILEYFGYVMKWNFITVYHFLNSSNRILLILLRDLYVFMIRILSYIWIIWFFHFNNSRYLIFPFGMDSLDLISTLTHLFLEVKNKIKKFNLRWKTYRKAFSLHFALWWFGPERKDPHLWPHWNIWGFCLVFRTGHLIPS